MAKRRKEWSGRSLNLVFFIFVFEKYFHNICFWHSPQMCAALYSFDKKISNKADSSEKKSLNLSNFQFKTELKYKSVVFSSCHSFTFYWVWILRHVIITTLKIQVSDNKKSVFQCSTKFDEKIQVYNFVNFSNFNNKWSWNCNFLS